MKTIHLVLLFVAVLAATALAVDPPPDGGYANGNTAEGQDALLNLSVGGIQNTALGFEALLNETSGDNNTATGYQSLRNNATGSANTATGAWALTANTTGNTNTATGMWALTANTTGSANTAAGLQALYSNTTGTSNTATGVAALFENVIGSNNTATGYFALIDNSSGNSNTAQGYLALANNQTGDNSTAVGASALANNMTGGTNTACGAQALFNNSAGSNNIALGNLAGSNLTTGSNNIDIAAVGAIGESNTMRIGKLGVQKNTYIAGIRGTTVAGGVAVMVDGVGHIGTVTSSARYKEAIKAMDKASETILMLKPVTFRYKHELDPDAIPQFGLVAEDVAKVNPDLVARDEMGKPYTVRYEAVNAMLLNEFLKAHKKAEQQEASINELKSMISGQQELIKRLAAQIKSVSNRVDRNGGATPALVSNQMIPIANPDH